MRRLTFKKHCTCGEGDSAEKHYLRCDLMYAPNFFPRKRKRFYIFYPLKER
jgi:hypothetical protein